MNDRNRSIDLSIVIPARNEQANLPELYRHLSRILDEIRLSWEILIIDDGSADGTWRAILALNDEDARVRGIRFSRNFGHQYALFAGLQRARGSAVISMDADLEHPPDLINRLVDAWRSGAKIVHTVRQDDRRTPFFKRLTSRLFYRVYAFLSGVRLESGMADFRLLDRKVVNDILSFREEGLFLRGIVHWVGYPSEKISYTPGNRTQGVSQYSWRKMFSFSWTGITSFSVVPLRIGIVLGIFMSCFAFLEIVYTLYVKFILKAAVPGWTSLVTVTALLFGVLFILIGLLGEYIGRVLIEVQNRPRYLISDEIR